jgi:Zn-dependent metalloprotease
MKKLLLCSWMLLSGWQTMAWQSQAGNFEVRGVHKKSGLPSFIIFGTAVPTAAGLNGWFRSNLGANDDFELRLQKTSATNAVNYHERYWQFYKGYRVEGATVNVHYQAGKAYSLNGAFYPRLDVPVNAAITPSAALDKAMQLFQGAVFAWQQPAEEKILQRIKKDPSASWYPKAELVLVSASQLAEDFRLAYRLNIYTVLPLAHKAVYIDAVNGQVLAVREKLQTENVTGIAHTRYSGIQTITCDSVTADSFVLEETTRGDGITALNLRTFMVADSIASFTDSDNVWNNINAAGDEVATDVHWGLEKTYDYYQSVLGRNSIDDMGHGLAGLVHFGKKFNNAFWNGSFASFGDGDGVSMNALTSLDICAHEITHGLTQMTAGLDYSDESGALNESFSDIFGKCVEYYAIPALFNWKLGEAIAPPGKESMRNMKDPNSRLDPWYYQGLYYYTGTMDNGGVHTNSGVQNYWFYLLCEGGSGLREADGKPFNVKPIGIAKAAQIAYLNLSAYLTEFSTYPDAAVSGIEAAKMLYGASSKEAFATQMAWYAVGLADMPVEVSVTDPNTAGSGLKVFPNPVRNYLNMALQQPTSSPVQLSLYNSIGQLVYQQPSWDGQNLSLDMSRYPKGLYLLELNDRGTIQREKISCY